MIERAKAQLRGVERPGTTPTRIVQILDEDGNFLGFDPTDEQIDEIAEKQGFSERERNILRLHTLNYHQALARIGLREIERGAQDKKKNILNRAALGIRNHTTNERDEGENDD